MSEISASDRDIPVKKQKIHHREKVSSSSDDSRGTKNGEELAERPAFVDRTSNGTEPREFQAVQRSNMAGGGDGPQSNNSAETSSSSKTDEDASDTEHEYQLPALKMPEVFDFSNLNYEDRLADLFGILHDLHPFQVKQAFAYHVGVEAAALRDYQAVWRSHDLACDVLVEMKGVNHDSFPIMMEVELVEPFCCLPGSTCSSITQEQVYSYFQDNKNKVDVMEIFPVHDDTGDLDEGALAIEHARFFFDYVWRFSDDNDTGNYSFVLRHLEPRLKLYYDVLNKKVSSGLALKYQNTITEYQSKLRLLHQKQALLESDEDDDYSEEDADNEDSDKDSDSGKNNENKDSNKEKGCDKDNSGDLDKDRDMDNENGVEDSDGGVDNVKGIGIEDNNGNKDKTINRDKDGGKDKHSEDRDGDRDNDTGIEDRDSDKDITMDKGGCSNTGKDEKGEDEYKDSDKQKKILEIDELELVEMARLWKDVSLLQDTLEMMENPVMRYLTDLPVSGRKRELSSAVEIRQTRHHKELVTHVVAEKITAGMLQDLQLPADTVIETHATPASALAGCYVNDTVLILPGTYSGEGLSRLKESVTIQGIGNPENVVIVHKFRETSNWINPFVGCFAQNLSISNLTFVDDSTEDENKSDSEDSGRGGVLTVGFGTTRLTNCHFNCRSTGLVVQHCNLNMDNCEVSGAQAPGLTLWQGSRLIMKSCRIHDCGKKAPAPAEETCGVRIDSPQRLENKSANSSTSVTIQGCKIQGNSGPGLLLKIYSTEKHRAAKTADLDDLCTLTCCDLQVTDTDLSGNGKGVAMVSYYELDKQRLGTTCNME